MVVSFSAVTAVTVGVLAMIVGVVIALMLAGMAEVGAKDVKLLYCVGLEMYDPSCPKQPSFVLHIEDYHRVQNSPVSFFTLNIIIIIQLPSDNLPLFHQSCHPPIYFKGNWNPMR